MAATKIPTTQEHLDIEDIRNDLVVLKNGAAAAILQTNAVNFDLLSENEQDAMIFAYASFLNSLTFPVQTVIRSKRMDVSNYLARLASAKRRAPNVRIAGQIELYERFIRDIVSRNQVLDKRFYVVVPYTMINITQVATLGFSVLKKTTVTEEKWHTLEKARVNLEPKIAHVVKQLARIGIKSRQLRTEEFVELFYDWYNPETAREQKAALTTAEYNTPIVEPAIAPVIEEAQNPNQLNTEQP